MTVLNHAALINAKFPHAFSNLYSLPDCAEEKTRVLENRIILWDLVLRLTNYGEIANRSFNTG